MRSKLKCYKNQRINALSQVDLPQDNSKQRIEVHSVMGATRSTKSGDRGDYRDKGTLFHFRVRIKRKFFISIPISRPKLKALPTDASLSVIKGY